MPGVKIKAQDGSEGTFDPVVFLKDQVSPDVTIKDINFNNGIVKYSTPDGEGEFDVPTFLSKNANATITGIDGDAVNTPETAIDSSFLTFKQRMLAGLTTREAPEAARTMNALMGFAGIEPGKTGAYFDEAQDEKSKGRVMAALKKSGAEFDDVKFINGELTLKKNGAWYKANAEGLDRGDIAEFMGSTGMNIAGAIAGGFIAGPVGAVAGSAVGEAAEEALAAGLSDGKLNIEDALGDIVTEAMFAAFGEGAGQVAGKGLKVAGAAYKGSIAEKGLNAATKAVQEQAAKIRFDGMGNIAKNAAAETKEFIAKTISFFNKSISKQSADVALGTEEQFLKVKNLANLTAKTKPGEVNPVDKMMESTFDNYLSAVKSTRDEVYSDLSVSVNRSLEKNPEKFSIDLENLASYIQDASNDVVDDHGKDVLKSFRKIAEGKIEKLKPANVNLGSGSEVPKSIQGKKAYNLVNELHEVMDGLMTSKGVFKAGVSRSKAETSLNSKLFDILDHLDNKRNLAVEAADAVSDEGLSLKFNKLRSVYPKFQEAYSTFSRKDASSVNAFNFYDELAKGENASYNSLMKGMDDAIQVMTEVNTDLPYVASNKMRLQMGEMLAGKEFAAAFKLPRSGQGGVINYITNFGTNLTAIGAGRKVAMAPEKAKEAARMIMTLAQGSGKIATQNPLTKKALLENPSAYAQVYSTIGRVAAEQMGQTKRVMDAATARAINEPEGDK